MGACNSANGDIRSVVENFHLYTDKQFISHLETKTCISTEDRTKKKDYTKLNDPINMFSDTILHYAVFHNRQELVRYLLSNGADFKKLNQRKKSPLDLAHAKNLTGIIQLFEGAK